MLMSLKLPLYIYPLNWLFVFIVHKDSWTIWLNFLQMLTTEFFFAKAKNLWVNSTRLSYKLLTPYKLTLKTVLFSNASSLLSAKL